MRVAAALLLVTLAGVARSQTIRVSGTVVDERQAPISGAIVRLTGDRSTTTGVNGRFEFGDDRYLITAEGMQPGLVERIESYRSAGAPAPSLRARTANTRNFGTLKMVRIYTRRYVSTLPRQDVLPRIVYMGTGLKPTCQ